MTIPLQEYSGKRSSSISSSPLDIENSILGVIQFATQPNVFLERRAHERVAYTQLFPITPIDNPDEMQVCGETVFVAGKNLSPCGIGFFHQNPIPSRYVVVSLQHAKDGSSHYLVKISWCRFLHPGWYDSGGQIMRMVKWEE